jgi:hypothetical protein
MYAQARLEVMGKKAKTQLIYLEMKLGGYQ